ncbi:hypothetical protein NEUTE2DRAFT_69750 [Neurospora tetrasperma FGSC 2509]|nr:hypothetical protein NEUTE2DRAFT_69750 [Neurospora tetrasperma FGSC 2509]
MEGVAAVVRQGHRWTMRRRARQRQWPLMSPLPCPPPAGRTLLTHIASSWHYQEERVSAGDLSIRWLYPNPGYATLAHFLSSQ